MPEYSMADIQQALTPVFKKFGVKSAVLFGSYAKGCATVKSDVDILVDSGLRGMAFFGLMDSVASSLSIPVDLLDVSQVRRNSPIDREIRSSGVQIYGQ